MFIVLLSPCTTSRLAESLASTSEGRIKCLVRHEWYGCKWGLNESVCIQIIYGILINFVVTVKN